MSGWPRWFAIAGLVLVLGVANYTIAERQQVVDSGRPILLELRPVDPRSLMQGDFMVLRYADALFPPREQRDGLPARGAFVVQLDGDGVATFSRLDDGGALAANEARLRYKLIEKHGEIRLGAESFFFQEGQAELFNPARYGVLHADEAGNTVLVGLADEKRQRIVPPEYSR